MPRGHIRAEEIERGVGALLANPLVPPSTQHLAEVMGVRWETAKKHRRYMENLVEEFQEATDAKIAPQFSVVREICLAAAIQPEKIEKASHKDLMIGAGIADDHWRLASGKSTSNIHLLQEITTREQLASRFRALGLLDVGLPSSRGEDHPPK